MEEKTKKLIVIVGPTAVGKTAVALRIAEALKTEIISADSRQVFKEMEIGTAKPAPSELKQVPHHFINTKSIHEDYDAGQFGRDALDTIHQLFETHATVVLCGGSGLYVKAVCEGFDEMPQVTDDIRDAINKKYEEFGLEWLQHQVQQKDPDYFLQVDQKNPHRLIRALELIEVTNQPIASLRKQKKHQHDFDVVKFGLELDREALYQRIDNRMDKMIDAGLFEEAKQLYPLKHLNALQTVGYTEIFNFMEGQYDREEAIRLLKRNSRHYAKRQFTWFRKDKDIRWLDATDIESVFTTIIKTLS